MKEFPQDYIEDKFRKLAAKLGRPVKIHVIGGGAMAFRNQKGGTKDIDVILETETEADALASALEKVGYKDPLDLDPAYRRMDARRMLENSDEFRWDIFVQDVMGFHFSSRMRERSEPWTQEGQLTVVAAAPEDIFTFKALTDRPRDRDDMDVLWAGELDAATIREEVLAQAENPAGKRFAVFFYHGLMEFIELTGAVVPDVALYERLCDRETIADVLDHRLQEDSVDLDAIAEELELDPEAVQEAADRLVRQGLAVRDALMLRRP